MGKDLVIATHSLNPSPRPQAEQPAQAIQVREVEVVREVVKEGPVYQYAPDHDFEPKDESDLVQQLREQLRLPARAIDNALQLQEEADVKCEELVKQLTASEKRSNYLVAKVRALADDLNDEKIAEEAQGIYAEQPYYNVYGLSGAREPQATQPREPEFGL